MKGKISKSNKKTTIMFESKLVKRGNILNPSFAFSVSKEWIKTGILKTSSKYRLTIEEV